uniref:Small ribosomal subunit protein bS18m n=1 Tax=Geotrypetes seraphini TaxID=260995 RepID=A0A6P8SIX8_GEOSA|nr:28S ribosomal protein S18c, mitochondrial [Geotrypetes seraphini]
MDLESDASSGDTLRDLGSAEYEGEASLEYGDSGSDSRRRITEEAALIGQEFVEFLVVCSIGELAFCVLEHNCEGARNCTAFTVLLISFNTLLVLWRRSYSLQDGVVTYQEDLPIQMENPYKESPKKCVLCGISVNYKNTQLLSQFISPYTGRIYGRHITGLCGKKQKEIAKTIRRAHVMGFMPVTYKDPAFLSDPKICDIRLPV